ncbi:hypothetical protein OBBRIDRAFT_488782 [Obba rivulosa]|uniref:Uncharacterized protein n=1 Tax=Obba rivulosa TaxID=1052685 RepID=A0A8E2DMB0_9APHY|nr:hypothetical protein OBBRIDRAFT_488782 [Obba rivulosa]
MSDNKQGVSNVSSTTEMSSGRVADAISPHRHHHHHHHLPHPSPPTPGPEPTPKTLCLSECTCTDQVCSCDKDCHCKEGSMSLESAEEDARTTNGTCILVIGCKAKLQK